MTSGCSSSQGPLPQFDAAVCCGWSSGRNASSIVMYLLMLVRHSGPGPYLARTHPGPACGLCGSGGGVALRHRVPALRSTFRDDDQEICRADYYEPEMVTDAFVQGRTQGEDGVMRAWWPQISIAPFRSHLVRVSTIWDPLIRYIHQCIVTTISARGLSQEWVTTSDLFYLHSLMTGMSCNLARCFACTSPPFITVRSELPYGVE
ncbi:hypothetical protein R6Q57_005657, partial [Mikania cordata]